MPAEELQGEGRGERPHPGRGRLLDHSGREERQDGEVGEGRDVVALARLQSGEERLARGKQDRAQPARPVGCAQVEAEAPRSPRGERVVQGGEEGIREGGRESQVQEVRGIEDPGLHVREERASQGDVGVPQGQAALTQGGRREVVGRQVQLLPVHALEEGRRGQVGQGHDARPDERGAEQLGSRPDGLEEGPGGSEDPSDPRARVTSRRRPRSACRSRGGRRGRRRRRPSRRRRSPSRRAPRSSPPRRRSGSARGRPRAPPCPTKPVFVPSASKRSPVTSLSSL